MRDLQGQFERARDRLLGDGRVSVRNRELLQRFLREAALGKTVPHRGKKKIGMARLHAYVNHLRFLIFEVQCDLDKVGMEEMERFIERLESGEILGVQKRCMGTSEGMVETLLSLRYRVDIKVTVKKFYKWLWGKSREYPALVEWVDTHHEPEDVQALTEVEVERMLDRCRYPLQRAVIQVLFDGGFRLGELLSIRLRHVAVRTLSGEGGQRECFTLHVPVSKTYRRTVVLAMPASTKWLKIWLEDHPAKPRFARGGCLEAEDLEASLFPLSENAMRLLVKRLGKRALGKRVYPHLLRHTSATFWSNRLPYFRLCKRFGWSMTSKMPQRYIDREGVDELGALGSAMPAIDPRPSLIHRDSHSPETSWVRRDRNL